MQVTFDEKVNSLVEDKRLPDSKKLLVSFNVFSGDLERVEALMESIEIAADMAADFGDEEEAPPMVIRTWRLAQIMEKEGEKLKKSYERLRAYIFNSIFLLTKNEKQAEAAAAVKDVKQAAARERRNAARRAARAAKKAAPVKPAPSGKKKAK